MKYSTINTYAPKKICYIVIKETRWTENKSKPRMIIWNPWHGRHKISEGRQRDNGVSKQAVIKNIFEKFLRNLS